VEDPVKAQTMLLRASISPAYLRKNPAVYEFQHTLPCAQQQSVPESALATIEDENVLIFMKDSPLPVAGFITNLYDSTEEYAEAHHLNKVLWEQSQPIKRPSGKAPANAEMRACGLRVAPGQDSMYGLYQRNNNTMSDAKFHQILGKVVKVETRAIQAYLPTHTQLFWANDDVDTPVTVGLAGTPVHAKYTTWNYVSHPHVDKDDGRFAVIIYYGKVDTLVSYFAIDSFGVRFRIKPNTMVWLTTSKYHHHTSIEHVSHVSGQEYIIGTALVHKPSINRGYNNLWQMHVVPRQLERISDAARKGLASRLKQEKAHLKELLANGHFTKYDASRSMRWLEHTIQSINDATTKACGERMDLTASE
jgi:hypothetical protein